MGTLRHTPAREKVPPPPPGYGRASTLPGAGRGSGITGHDGFSLVEMMIAVTLGTIVVAGAFSIFNSQQKATRAEDVRREVQQNARYALDFLRRDLQEAGEGMDPNSEFGVIGMLSGTSASDPDSVFILFVEPGTESHGPTGDNPAGAPNDSVKLKITCDDPVSDLSVNDFLYLANQSARGVSVITAVNRQETRTCGGSVSGADSIGAVSLGIEQVDGERHGWIWPEARNDDQAAFMKVQGIAYFIDESEADNPKLIRATRYETQLGDPRWEGRPLAEGVAQLQAGLIFADGDTLSSADASDSDPENDYDDVNSVVVRLRALARRTDKDLAGGSRFGRSYGMTVTPRNQLYTRNLNN